MKTARRFVKDESGMTMVLAIIMIVLLGVMGAGLLTFADRDLNTLAEQNRGQSAFEVADAGVGLAKRQLTDDCAGDLNCIYNYDRSSLNGTITDQAPVDLAWSALKADGTTGGVTLDNLDGDGTTTDRVHVTIDYHFGRDEFKIISTGTYGESKRKIEAILKGIGGSFGGDGIGHPLYYSPSNVTIEGTTDAETNLHGISMFTKGDIIIEGVANQTDFVNDYRTNNFGVFDIPNTDDALGDWYSPDFKESPGDWNTQPRFITTVQGKGNLKTDSFEEPGFAAEGRICGVPANSQVGTCDSRQSIADGVYAYDCTTGPVVVDGCTRNPTPLTGDTVGEVSRGSSIPENRFTFVRKEQEVDPDTGKLFWDDNDPGTITYPFPRPEPREARLARIAQEQQEEGAGGYYYRGCSPPWNTIFGNSTRNSVLFVDLGDCVDAEGDPLPITMTTQGNVDGILVVWCGDLRVTGPSSTQFMGILMNLNGDGGDFGSSCVADTDIDGDPDTVDCDPRFGVYRNNGTIMRGWLYAEGGDDSRSGIELGPGSTVHFYSGADWNFLDDAFSGTPPSGFSIRSWRECYELEPQETCST